MASDSEEDVFFDTFEERGDWPGADRLLMEIEEIFFDAPDNAPLSEPRDMRGESRDFCLESRDNREHRDHRLEKSALEDKLGRESRLDSIRESRLESSGDNRLEQRDNHLESSRDIRLKQSLDIEHKDFLSPSSVKRKVDVRGHRGSVDYPNDDYKRPPSRMFTRRGRKHFDDGPDSEKFRKLFIGGLSCDTNEEGLKKHFSKWGKIVDCVVMRNHKTKRSRGFGFITYKSVSEVDEAQKHRPHVIDNREVETRRAMPRDEAGSPATVKKLFVGGLKEDTTDDQLKKLFEPHGKVFNIDLISDKATGRRRGFGYVSFEDYDTVDKLVLKKYMNLNGKQIEVKKALPRSERIGSRVGGGAALHRPV